MRKKTKTSPFSLVIILLLSVAMIAGVYLVGQNQETRRGAYFTNAKLIIQPETMSREVGEDVPVQLWVQTENNAKVSAVTAKICYGSKLKLDAVDVAELIALNTTAFKTLEFAQDTPPCLKLVALSGSISNANLKSGMVKVATIRFKAIKAGSGQINIPVTSVEVSGYNPSSNDVSMKVATTQGATYTIVSSGGPTNTPKPPTPTVPFTLGCHWCGSECVPQVNDLPCSTEEPPQGMQCKQVGDECRIVPIIVTAIPPTETPEPTPTDDNPGCTPIVCPAGEVRFCPESEVRPNCDDGCGYMCAVPTPTQVPPTQVPPTDVPPTQVPPTQVPPTDVPPTGNSKFINFNMSFYGIDGGGKCALAKDLPLDVTVRSASGPFKTYRDIISTMLDDGIYNVKFLADGFTYADNVSIFVKSPKHLQVKYGVDGQDFFFNEPGGELSGLTEDEQTTPEFNFSGYPLLAGDVTGPDGEQDGVVDGVDFSFVKTKAELRVDVNDGEYMLADLNGNCQMESQDVALLMKSLEVKQEQLY